MDNFISFRCASGCLMPDSLERKLIASLTDLKSLELVYSLGLRAEAFEEPICRSVFGWSMEYWRRTRTAPTQLIFSVEFPALELPEIVDESVEWLVDTLQRRFATNAAQQIMLEAARSSAEDPVGTLRMLAAEAYRASGITTPRRERVDMSANVEERHLRYGQRAEVGTTGVTLGLAELDTHVNGLQPGELCVVTARTSVGKSFWLAHQAVRARRLGQTPMLITLEQPVSEMENRIDAFASGVSFTRLNNATLRMDESAILRHAREELASHGPLYVERPPRGERTVVDILNRARQLGVNVLLIDQLSFMEPHGNPRTDKEKFAQLIFDMKAECSNEASGALPVTLAVQLNRAAVTESKETTGSGGRGELHNFAGATEIEQTCDHAIGLWRNQEHRNNMSMMCDLLKSRRADTLTLMLEWQLSERSVIRTRGPLT